MEPGYIGVVGRMSVNRPIVMPEAFSGEGSFADWLDHLERVAQINKWKDKEKTVAVGLSNREGTGCIQAAQAQGTLRVIQQPGKGPVPAI